MTTMIQEMPKAEIDPLAAITFTPELKASHSALLKVCCHINPDKSVQTLQTGRLKLLFAALITEAEKLRDRELFPETLGDGKTPHVPNVNANEKTREGRTSCEQAIHHLEAACLLMLKAALL